MKEHFNVGAGTKEHDELKRKREEYAVNIRVKKR
jgi:hypothetical protein